MALQPLPDFGLPHKTPPFIPICSFTPPYSPIICLHICEMIFTRIWLLNLFIWIFSVFWALHLTTWSRVLEKLVKKFPAFLEPEFSSPHSQQPATCPYPEPDQSTSCLLSHFVKISFTVILQSTSRFSKQYLCPRYPRQNPVCIYPISHACHMPRPSQRLHQDMLNSWPHISYRCLVCTC